MILPTTLNVCLHHDHRRCLQPLVGSRFGHSITSLCFDPTVLPPAAVRELAAAFPNVSTISWVDGEAISSDIPLHSSSEGWKAIINRVSTSLVVAAAAMPCLSSVGVGCIIGKLYFSVVGLGVPVPTYTNMESALVPLMMCMDAYERRLRLTLEDSPPDVEIQSKHVWMQLREKWAQRTSSMGMDTFVDMVPV